MLTRRENDKWVFGSRAGLTALGLVRRARFPQNGTNQQSQQASSFSRGMLPGPDVPDGEWYDYDMVQVVFEQMLELKKLQMQCEDKEINEPVSFLGIIFFQNFCLYKTQEDIKQTVFIKVLRGL